MWAVCVLTWCLFLGSLCVALILDQKIIDEVERDLAIGQRPSLTSLNGRRVATAACKRHAMLFPHSRLRSRNLVAWASAGLSLFAMVTTTFPVCNTEEDQRETPQAGQRHLPACDKMNISTNCRGARVS